MKECLVVAYGDTVTNISADQLVKFHKKHGELGTVALFRVPWKDTERFGIAELKGSIITSFIEKPRRQEAKSNLANAGYFVIEAEVLGRIPHKKNKMESTVFTRLAKEKRLAGFVCRPDYWLDIGTIEAYRDANRMIETIIAPPRNEAKVF